ncbi:MAG: DUF4270 domain-containing protein [Flavobacterium sp.]|nr:DUF4270 domain-containing protein [Flavobacterium sp.]
MKFNAFLKTVFLVFTIIFIVSCDKDFNEVGSDLIDDVHYNFNSAYASVTAYNAPIGPVQTSNLPINSLGFYHNEGFGTTTASFVTQLELAATNPKFYGEEDLTKFKIDSVYLYVPYFSTFKSTDSGTGDSTYELDSIQGGTQKIKLGVFESNYFLRTYDPASNLQEQQVYYSDEKSLVEAVTDVTNFDNRLNRTPGTPHPDQDEHFEFKSTEIKLLKNNESGAGTVKERLAPGIYMDLNKDFFMNKIVNAPAGSLVDNNAFKTYFKGLYFKASPETPSSTQGTMARLNFAQGKIVMIYHGKDSDDADDLYERKTLTIEMGGKTVNFIENNFVNPVTPNTVDGDQRLYLKGGAGSMAVIKILSDSEILNIRNNGWLINEANLVFNIDKQTLGTTIDEPNRIYLYDLKNKRPIIDYSYDTSTNGLYPKFNKFVHDGIIQLDEDKNGIKYKIRLTNHVRNIIKHDSTNVSLGLVVTESINDTRNAKLKNPFTAFGTEVKYIPAMSVANPLGTILWGNNIPVSSDDYEKRLKFEIFYTKPD